MGLRLGFKCIFQNKIRLGESLFDAAAFHRQCFGYIILNGIVQQGRSRLHGFKRVENSRQFLPIHLNQFQSLFGNFFIHRGHSGNFIANVPYFFLD